MENKGNKNEEKLSFSSKIIIIDRMLGNIIELFLNTFLTAYFYKITPDNMIYISSYYIISWISATIGAFILGDYIKRKNKVKLYRYGTLVKCIYILLIILLKEKILDYVWLMAIIYGISVSMTGFPFNMMESELVSQKERTKYMGYRAAIGEVAKVVIPIFLGAYITYTSYQVAAILVLIFSIIKLINTCFIENKNIEKEKLNLRKCAEAIKENNNYPIKKLYAIEFLKGITVNGVLSIIISLLIVYEVETDLNLGMWSSFFSVCTILTMLIFAKEYDKYNSRKILTICSIAIITSFALLLFSINLTTIILYNIVYYIFIEILKNITEIRLFDYSNKPPFDKKFNTEYFVFREVFINLGRVVGYIVLLIVGLSHNANYLKVLFLFTTIALMLMIRISRKIKLEQKVGFTIGKFAPLHKGHQYLIETAIKEMDKFIVIIYETDLINIPIEVRAKWIEKLYPNVEIRYAKNPPKQYGLDKESVDIQMEYLSNIIKDIKPTHFYSSEPYGKCVADSLKIVDRRIDNKREQVSISATDIRNGLESGKEWLDEIVYEDCKKYI